jgi:CRP-like cAMP-binding protein
MTVELEQQLASVPLLAGLEPRVRSRLAAIGKRRTYTAGEAIVSEGTTGTALYILLSGRAKVDQDGNQLGELSAGDFFGELALIEEHPEVAIPILRVLIARLHRREHHGA